MAPARTGLYYHAGSACYELIMKAVAEVLMKVVGNTMSHTRSGYCWGGGPEYDASLPAVNSVFKKPWPPKIIASTVCGENVGGTVLRLTRELELLPQTKRRLLI